MRRDRATVRQLEDARRRSAPGVGSLTPDTRRPSFRRIFPRPGSGRDGLTSTPGVATDRAPGRDGRTPRKSANPFRPPGDVAGPGRRPGPGSAPGPAGKGPRPVGSWGSIGDPITPVIGGGGGTPNLPLIDETHGGSGGGGDHDGHYGGHHGGHHGGSHGWHRRHHYDYGRPYCNWYGFNDWYYPRYGHSYGWSFGVSYAWDNWWFSFGFGRPSYYSGGGYCVNPWRYRRWYHPWNAYRIGYRTCSVVYTDPWYDDYSVCGGYCGGACGSSACFATYVSTSFDDGYAGWGGVAPAGYVGSGTDVLALVEPTYISIEDRIASGWSLLAAGAIDAARDEFDRLLDDVPWEAEVHLGFGLASAMLGDEDSAVAALRRAIAQDARVIERVPGDPTLDGLLLELVDAWSDRVRRDLADVDALFVVGTLRAILTDYPVAFFAVDAAARAGDDHESTLNLRALLEVALYEDL